MQKAINGAYVFKSATSCQGIWILQQQYLFNPKT